MPNFMDALIERSSSQPVHFCTTGFEGVSILCRQSFGPPTNGLAGSLKCYGARVSDDEPTRAWEP